MSKKTRWVETMLKVNPWSTLDLPSKRQLRATRVSAAIQWGFFWAVDEDAQPLLILQHEPSSIPPTVSFPQLKGIQVELDKSINDQKLVFRLLDITLIDIFHELCLDIIASTSSAPTEADALKQSLQRTWRWHYLLRGGSSGLLTEIEQKGLIGELLVLERFILESFDSITAVSCWTGPEGAPKDFECGDVCIETKTRRGAAKSFVKISSEDQLDTKSIGRLILFVLDVSRSVLPGAANPSLSDIAVRVKATLALTDALASEVFEQKLLSIGFRWEDDYEDYRWIIGKHSLFEVNGDFPRIVPHSLTLGISRVTYALGLEACAPYKIDEAEFFRALQGESHAG